MVEEDIIFLLSSLHLYGAVVSMVRSIISLTGNRNSGSGGISWNRSPLEHLVLPLHQIRIRSRTGHQQSRMSSAPCKRVWGENFLFACAQVCNVSLAEKLSYVRQVYSTAHERKFRLRIEYSRVATFV